MFPRTLFTRVLLSTFLLALLLGVPPARVAHAASIAVNTTTDEYGTGASCSLREAIQAANTNSAFGGCTAGSGADTITLPAGTYTLTGSSGEDNNATGDLDVNSTITIQGAGAGSTIIQAGTNSSNGIDRVFHVTNSSGDLTLENVTVRYGKTTGPGGGIYINWGGTVSAVNSAISNNISSSSGGGIYADTGTVNITNSTISGNSAAGNGGGIDLYGPGTLNVNNSTLSGNSSASNSGGGIYGYQGTVTVNNSTLSGNSADDYGGGVYNYWGTLNVNNSTLSGNSATSVVGGGGGIGENSGIGVYLRNSTLSGNSASSGGGIDIFGSTSVNLQNSIITNSTGGDCDGTFIGSNNLVDSSSDGCSGVRTGAVTNFDATLRGNGGDTQTHALLAGSNALDAGTSSCPDTSSNPLTRDQRSVIRPLDGDQNGAATCDIGAFERQSTGYGPGGVGLTDGSSSLTLWLKADDGTGQTTDGSAVSTWQDKSGKGHDVSQSTGSNQPTYRTNVQNGQPVVRFDNTDYLSRNVLGSDLFSASADTILFAKKSTSTSGVWFKWESASTNRVGIEIVDGWFVDYPRFDFPNDSSGKLEGNPNINGIFRIITGLKSSTTQTLYVDGAQDVTQGNSLSLNTASTQELAVGKNNGGGLSWTGDIAETIVYNTNLNTAERILAENYLSTKYGVAADNDRYTGNDSAYIRDVAGIGKESDGINAEAHSAGLALINNPYLTDNGDYVVVGHSTATNDNTTSDLVSPVVQRWQRVWYLDRTDGGASANGNLKIAFDFSEGSMDNNGAAPGTASNYRLLRRSLTTGNFSTVTTASTSVVGDQVVFTVADGNLADGYYTLGTTDGSTSPTAITLRNLDARSTGDIDGMMLPLALLALAIGGLGFVWRRRRGTTTD